MSARQERLEDAAEKATGKIVTRLLEPFDQSLSTLEAVLPGITRKLATKINLDEFRTACSREAAAYIKDLRVEGSEHSLRLAIKKVDELRRLGENSRRGLNSRLSDEQKTRLAKALATGPKANGFKANVWTPTDFAVLTKKQCGVSYTCGHMSRVMRQLTSHPEYRKTKANLR